MGADYHLMQVHKSAATVRGYTISDLSTPRGKNGSNVMITFSSAVTIIMT